MSCNYCHNPPLPGFDCCEWCFDKKDAREASKKVTDLRAELERVTQRAEAAEARVKEADKALGTAQEQRDFEEQRRRSVEAAVVGTVGGQVDGAPTTYLNYLQRLRALVRSEARLARMREALEAAYAFHKQTECVSEGREECSCRAFEPVRAALAPTPDTPAPSIEDDVERGCNCLMDTNHDCLVHSFGAKEPAPSARQVRERLGFAPLSEQETELSKAMRAPKFTPTPPDELTRELNKLEPAPSEPDLLDEIAAERGPGFQKLVEEAEARRKEPAPSAEPHDWPIEPEGVNETIQCGDTACRWSLHCGVCGAGLKAPTAVRPGEADDLVGHFGEGDARLARGLGWLPPEEVERRVAEAVAAERERAGGLCDRWLELWREGSPEATWQSLAAAIRKGTP